MYGAPTITYSTNLSSAELGQWCNMKRLSAYSQATYMLQASEEERTSCGYGRFSKEETVCKILQQAVVDIEKGLAKWEKANPS